MDCGFQRCNRQPEQDGNGGSGRNEKQQSEWVTGVHGGGLGRFEAQTTDAGRT